MTTFRRVLDSDFGLALVVLGGTYAGVALFVWVAWQILLALR